MKKLFHKLKRQYQKIYIRIVKNLEYERSMQQRYEIDAQNVCLKLISKEQSHLLMTSITQKRFIKSDEFDVLVTIDNNIINIVNHQYSYTVFVTEKTRKTICNEFDKLIESQRKKMEDEITSNIKFSLKNLSNKLD
jgi:hypothetical protein